MNAYIDSLEDLWQTERDEREAAECFAEMEYRERPVDVCCDWCGVETVATQEELERMKWHLSERYVLCPDEKVHASTAIEMSREAQEIGKAIGRAEMLRCEIDKYEANGAEPAMIARARMRLQVELEPCPF